MRSTADSADCRSPVRNPQSSICNLQYTGGASLPAVGTAPACPGVEVPAHVPSISACCRPAARGWSRCGADRGAAAASVRPRGPRRDRARRRSRSRPSPTRRWSSAISSPPTDGRAEVLLGDGSALHLDERTTVDFNGDTVVRLVSGRLIVLAERRRRRQPCRSMRRRRRCASSRRRKCIWRCFDDRGQADAAGRRRPRAGRRRQRRRARGGASRPAGVRPRGRGAQLSGALQLRAARRLRPLVAGAVRRPPRRDLRAVPAGRRARLRVDVRSVRIVELRRAVRLRLVSARGARRGGRTTTDAGVTRAATAGRSSATTRGAGPRITTAAGV